MPANRKLIPIVARVDGSQAKREINSIKQAFRSMTGKSAANQTARQFTQQAAAFRQAQAQQSRFLLEQERQRNRVVLQSLRQQESARNRSFRAQEAQRRRDHQDFVRAEKAKTRAAAAEARRRARNELGHRARQVGFRTRQLGQTALIGMTLPIIAAGRSLVDVGFKLDDYRNKLTAATGSIEAANDKLRELRQLSQDSAGVLQADAVNLFAMLKPIKGVTDEAINPLIQALGRLKLADREMDMTEFTRNLTQMFTQGFEMQDIKQAFNNFPRFGEVIAEKFGLEGTDRDSISKGLKQMVKDGKLTINEYFKGIAEAINEDESLGQLRDTLENRFMKAFERIQVALEPLAERILSVIEPMIDPLVKGIEFMVKAFDALSPAAQTVMVALAGIAAAVGPLLLIISPVATGLGWLVSGIKLVASWVSLVTGFITSSGGLLSALGALGTALAPIALKVAAVIAVLAALAGIAFTVYQAWQSNFGGIRDFVTDVFGRIQRVVKIAMDAVYAFTQEIGGEIVHWWNTNYKDIEATVKAVSETVKAITRAFLAALNAFWKEHGEFITHWVKASWQNVRTIVSGVVQHLLGVVKLVAAVFRGDWKGAWDAFLGIVENAVSTYLSLMKNMQIMVFNLVLHLSESVINTLWGLHNRIQQVVKSGIDWIVNNFHRLPGLLVGIVPAMFNAGLDIATAIWNGIKSGLAGGSIRLGSAAGGLDIVGGGGLGLSASAGLTGSRTGGGTGGGGGGRGGRGGGGGGKLSPIAELRKQIREAEGRRGLLTGNSEFRSLTTELDSIERYNSALDELIKKRAELGANVSMPIPQTFENITAELEALSNAESGLSTAKDLFKEFSETIKGIADNGTAVEKVQKLLADPQRASLISEENKLLLQRKAIEADAVTERTRILGIEREINNSHFERITNAQTELASLGAKNEIDLERIRLNGELALWAEENKNINREDLDILLAKKAAQNEEYLTLLKLIEAKRGARQAEEQTRSILGELNSMMVDQNSLTQEAIILKRLESEEYKHLTAAQRELILEKAKEVDSYRAVQEAQERAQRQFEELTDRIGGHLDNLRQNGFGAFFKGIFEDLQQWLVKLAAKWLASRFFKLLTGNDPAYKTGGGIFSGGAAPSGGFAGGLFGGGGFMNIFQGLFGGGGAGILGGGMGGGFLGGGASGALGHEGSHAGLAAAGKSGFGALAGIGAIASIAGGAIGGRLGNVLSMAGTGLSIGFMAGGPIGAAIGAGIGALIGLFGGDPKRKRDKNEKIPQLQEGFQRAFEDLRKILADLQNFQVSDVDSVLAQAQSIRDEIASGFGIRFESKKYRKRAASMIRQKTAEADSLIEQIADAGILAREKNEMRRAAEARERRLLPEFASGGFMRLNGRLAGSFTGRDTIPAMLANGEMVLNPSQIRRVIDVTGFDPFRFANIPNYAESGALRSANVPSFGSSPINITVVVEQDSQGVWRASAESPDGQRTIAKVVERKFRNDELRLVRR